MPTFFIKQKNGVSQINFENILPLDQNHAYLRQFTTNFDHLNSVSVLLKNPALKSRDEVIVEVLDQDQKLIKSLNIFGQGIEDPGWVRFKFSPLDSNKGDNFYIKISSDAKKDNDLYIYGNQNNQNINFKTSYKSDSLKQSFKESVAFQKEKLTHLNKTYLYSYLTVLIVINTLIFIL